MKDARAVRRTLAIALVLDGTSRAAAAAASGMDRQTLRDWVHRYNAGGLDGLSDQWAPGPEPALTRTQEQALIGWVELGPDLARDGVVRWRRADLRDRVLREFGVTVHERTVGKWLGQHGYCRLSVRPQHPKSDPAAQQAFKDDFADLVRATIPPEAAGKPVEIWWQDEARVGQQGTLTRVWARRGTRPRALRDQRRNSAYLFGAVCPERDTGAAIIMPQANTEAMNEHLAEISRCVTEGAYAVLVVDGAGWHTASRLVVPHNLGLLQLPTYAPELNPTETIWEYLRGNFLSHVVYASYAAVVAACSQAWNRLVATPGRIRSIATRRWAQVKVWRPVIGIREHLPVGHSGAAHRDEEWVPLGAPNSNQPPDGGKDFTPPFPAYPSGHATFGAACFETLKRFRAGRGAADPDVIDIDVVSDELNGVTTDAGQSEPRVSEPVERHFSSIEEMIRQNLESRVFLGVHWRFDGVQGVASGRGIAGIVAGRLYGENPGAATTA